MWLIYSASEKCPIWDLDGNVFEFETQRDADLVARVLTEYCFEKCEVIEV